MVDHSFGGPWTEEKLTRLQKYLEAYTVIFTRNERASHLRRVYVDAFAGTGARNNISDDQAETSQPLFVEDGDAQDYRKGSVRIALEIDPPFHEYIFIDRNPEFVRNLESLRDEFPRISDRITVRNGDANAILTDWARGSDWRGRRAVVFLDPYGMQVEWQTIEALAETKAVDLWLLFPLGQGVNRLLTKGGPPGEAWGARLTSCLGTDEWKDAFYRKSEQRHLFDDEVHYEKDATFESISTFVNRRLDAVFEKAAPNPMLLYNSRNNPIFLLCFAAANEVGAKWAVKIAEDILKG